MQLNWHTPSWLHVPPAATQLAPHGAGPPLDDEDEDDEEEELEDDEEELEEDEEELEEDEEELEDELDDDEVEDEDVAEAEELDAEVAPEVADELEDEEVDVAAVDVVSADELALLDDDVVIPPDDDVELLAEDEDATAELEVLRVALVELLEDPDPALLADELLDVEDAEDALEAKPLELEEPGATPASEMVAVVRAEHVPVSGLQVPSVQSPSVWQVCAHTRSTQA
ncbi:MAG: hypothetical protein AB2A00_12925 [Myxococcota bacterium]